MKFYSFCICIFLCMISCHKMAINKKVIAYQSIEGIHVGMSIKEALRILKEDFVINIVTVSGVDDEIASLEYTVSSTKNIPLFIFNGGYELKDKNHVFRIVLKSSSYLTTDGICVGMTVKDLIDKTKLKSADFNFDDGLFIESSIFHGGFWIAMDKNKVYKFTYDNPSIEDIPIDLAIKGIVIF